MFGTRLIKSAGNGSLTSDESELRLPLKLRLRENWGSAELGPAMVACLPLPDRAATQSLNPEAKPYFRRRIRSDLTAAKRPVAPLRRWMFGPDAFVPELPSWVLKMLWEWQVDRGTVAVLLLLREVAVAASGRCVWVCIKRIQRVTVRMVRASVYATKLSCRVFLEHMILNDAQQTALTQKAL